MPEHLRRITIPTADGSRHELSVMTPQDLDPLLQRLDRLERMGSLAEMLLSEGPAKLAEHLILEAVSLPPGDYTGVLETAEHLCEGTLHRLLTVWYGVTPEEIASHFPEVAAVVSPMDACLVQPSYVYRSEGAVFAKGGLVSKRDLPSAWNGSTHALCPRHVDSILYWNFDVVPNLSIYEAHTTTREEEAVPYAPPIYTKGFVNMHKASLINLVDSTGRSRLQNAYGRWDDVQDLTALAYTFRDWAELKSYPDEYYPDNETKLVGLPDSIRTTGLVVNSMFCGLTDVARFPEVDLSACPGTYLFQRNPARPPKTGIVRRAIVRNIGRGGMGGDMHTDLSGLVGWDKSDMEKSMSYAVHPPAGGKWSILLSADCYRAMSAATRASLVDKGFTIVNAG